MKNHEVSGLKMLYVCSLCFEIYSSAPPQNPWFRKSRFKGGKGKKLNIGGGGLGYRERPGLGAESSVSCRFLLNKNLLSRSELLDAL